MKDTASFLIKVLLLSTIASVLIKVAGPSLPLQFIEVTALNYLAVIIITLPSLALGTFLWFKTRSQKPL